MLHSCYYSTRLIQIHLFYWIGVIQISFPSSALLYSVSWRKSDNNPMVIFQMINDFLHLHNIFSLLDVAIWEERLSEMFPNTEFFLVRIFSVFIPNAGNYGPEKTPYLDSFHAVKITANWKYIDNIIIETSIYLFKNRNCLVF